MSESVLSEMTSGDDRHEPGRRRGSRRGGSSCLPILVVVVVFCLVGGWFARGAIADVKDMFTGPEDYAGPGEGQVMFVIDPGQSVGSMGVELEQLGVVASSQAFVDAAADNNRSTSIQAGTYELKKKMKSSDVVALLVDPKNVVTTTVTIPEGFTVDQIVARLAKQTKYPARKFQAVLAKPASYGLPAYAKGNPEGFLFPATYTFSPEAKPADMLKKMTARYEQALGDNDIEAVGASLGEGYTPEQIMTVASLVESEGRGDDMPKIARAIYNRLELPDGGGTNGLLQIDASVLYALDSHDPSDLVQPLADLGGPRPDYNTYAHAGLPPGPIGSPGEQAIQAALHPAQGDWVYWITVDCAGHTAFSTTLQEHQQHQAVDPSTCH